MQVLAINPAFWIPVTCLGLSVSFAPRNTCLGSPSLTLSETHATLSLRSFLALRSFLSMAAANWALGHLCCAQAGVIIL